jgi:hypothetical protein
VPGVRDHGEKAVIVSEVVRRLAAVSLAWLACAGPDRGPGAGGDGGGPPAGAGGAGRGQAAPDAGRLAGLVREGRAARTAGDAASAEASFRACLDGYARAAYPLGSPEAAGAAEAQFWLAEDVRADLGLRAADLLDPAPRFASAPELLDATGESAEAYRDVALYGSAYWSVAAGVQVGSVLAVAAARIRTLPGADPEAAETLEGQARATLRAALELAEEQGVDHDWSRRATAWIAPAAPPGSYESDHADARLPIELVARPRACPPEGRGRLHVVTPPAVPAARVFVDGVAHGSTPVVLTTCGGDHLVEWVWPSGATLGKRVLVDPVRPLVVGTDVAVPTARRFW